MENRDRHGSDHGPGSFQPQLQPLERDAVDERAAPRAVVIHEAIRKEGNDELQRSSSALAWSGLAAGLSMGLSLVTQGLLRAYLPEESWTPLLTKLGYSVGFLAVVLGRQQLFTENTVRAVLPFLSHRDLSVLREVARLWTVVLAANLLGAVAISWILGNTDVFDPEIRTAFADIGREALDGSFWTIFTEAIFAGWLIALMVWMLPAADNSRVSIIVIITYLVGLGGLAHVVAGSIDVMYLVMTGAAAWGTYLVGYLLPTLLGNAIGGVALVSILNHAQVVAGENKAG